MLIMTIIFLQCLILQKKTGNGLDEKKTAAYEIICSSFILKVIEKYNLLDSDTVGKIKPF